MGGPHDAEVTRVDRGDGGGLVAFGDRHHACIDEPEVVVGVRGEDLAGALVVDRGEVDDAELAASGSGDEAGFGGVAELRAINQAVSITTAAGTIIAWRWATSSSTAG